MNRRYFLFRRFFNRSTILDFRCYAKGFSDFPIVGKFSVPHNEQKIQSLYRRFPPGEIVLTAPVVYYCLLA